MGLLCWLQGVSCSWWIVGITRAKSWLGYFSTYIKSAYWGMPYMTRPYKSLNTAIGVEFLIVSSAMVRVRKRCWSFLWVPIALEMFWVSGCSSSLFMKQYAEFPTIYTLWIICRECKAMVRCAMSEIYKERFISRSKGNICVGWCPTNNLETWLG